MSGLLKLALEQIAIEAILSDIKTYQDILNSTGCLVESKVIETKLLSRLFDLKNEMINTDFIYFENKEV